MQNQKQIGQGRSPVQKETDQGVNLKQIEQLKNVRRQINLQDQTTESILAQNKINT